MKKTLHSIANISFIFFIVFGLIHISSSFLVVQGIRSKGILLVFNVLDLPFLLSGLSFGTAKFSLTLGEWTNKLKTSLIICSAIAVVLFLIALYFNFILPDASTLS